MQIIDAFLLATIISYFFGAVIPKQTVKNMPLWLEKIFLAVSGLILALNLYFFQNSYAWLVMGGFWTCAAGASYLGITKWNVDYQDHVTGLSATAQVTMWFWDLMIAISCFLKVA